MALSAVQTDQCDPAVGDSLPPVAGELNGSSFSLLNWNIKKGQVENWEQDLVMLASDMDLVLMQEATLAMQHTDFLTDDAVLSFAAGYRNGRTVSGVATFSAIEPLTRCQSTTYEPWLRTPKATMITHFALTGSEQTLLVINTHMINFSLGHQAYRAQLDVLENAMLTHDGPVVLSGDFNTWRPARARLLHGLAARLELQAVEFDEDHRVRFFGSPVDHVFIAGLRVHEAIAYRVESSDHNPMSLRLGLL